jgi:hypothetical protein
MCQIQHWTIQHDGRCTIEKDLDLSLLVRLKRSWWWLGIQRILPKTEAQTMDRTIGPAPKLAIGERRMLIVTRQQVKHCSFTQGQMATIFR